MSSEVVFVVEADEADRADKVVAKRFPGVSRRRIAAMFRAGDVRIDGARAKKGDSAGAGSRMELTRRPPDDHALRAVPDESLDLDVIYNDSWLVAVNKPPGIPSHPLAEGERGTAANGIVHRFPACAQVGDDPREAGLVHRLDAGTSGVLLAALDQDTWSSMRGLFGSGRVSKTYLALVEGIVTDGEATAPLAQRGRRVVVDDSGLGATTSWVVSETLGGFTLLRCTATSGRMHQVRAHLAHAGHPIAGDLLYGGPVIDEAPLVSHFLHAETIALDHPRTGAHVSITAPLSDDRRTTLTRLRDGPQR